MPAEECGGSLIINGALQIPPWRLPDLALHVVEEGLGCGFYFFG